MRECGFSAALSAGGQPALSANPGPPCTLSLFLTTKKMPSLAAGGRWRASQDKEIFRLSQLPHPPPTHHDDRWCSSCATKCSRSAAGEGCDVREGCTRDSTNVSVFLSKGSLLLHSCCCYSGRGAVCGNFQLSQTLSSQQRRRRRQLFLTHTSIARTLTTT